MKYFLLLSYRQLYVLKKDIFEEDILISFEERGLYCSYYCFLSPIAISYLASCLLDGNTTCIQPSRGACGWTTQFAQTADPGWCQGLSQRLCHQGCGSGPPSVSLHEHSLHQQSGEQVSFK